MIADNTINRKKKNKAPFGLNALSSSSTFCFIIIKLIQQIKETLQKQNMMLVNCNADLSHLQISFRWLTIVIKAGTNQLYI